MITCTKATTGWVYATGPHNTTQDALKSAIESEFGCKIPDDNEMLHYEQTGANATLSYCLDPVAV
jgi:hypothetical protein